MRSLQHCTYAPCGEKVKPESFSADILLSIRFVSRAGPGWRSDLSGKGLDTGTADGEEERYYS